MLFLHEFERIEAEAFLTLAAEMIEEDGIVTAEEDALLEDYTRALGLYGFTYDAAAAAAARDTMAQLNEVSRRKVYMELYSFAICDEFEDPAERRALNELRDALGLDEKTCRTLERCAQDLFSVYAAIEDALGEEDESEETASEDAAEDTEN